MPYPSVATWPAADLWPGVDLALFTPPQRTQTVMLEGSLRYTYPVSQTVWKDSGGTWRSQEVPYMGDLIGASYVFSSPALVDLTLAAELVATGIGTVVDV